MESASASQLGCAVDGLLCPGGGEALSGVGGVEDMGDSSYPLIHHPLLACV